MFHGSRIENWVGILTRGILLPEAVTKLGVRRTVRKTKIRKKTEFYSFIINLF